MAKRHPTGDSWAGHSTLESSGEHEFSVERIPALTILSHPDAKRVGDVARLTRLVPGASQAVSRLEPPFIPPAGAVGAPLVDRYVSRRPVIIERVAADHYRVSAEHTSAGLRIDGESVSGALDLDGAQLDVGVVLEVGGRVSLVFHCVGAATELDPGLGLVGANDGMAALQTGILRVADLDLSVLIRGESGTGKELVAAAIHRRSPRSRSPLVSVNMAALPHTTAASELFGHKRGAFTGATSDREGYFGRADRGTLFLDEIAAAPIEVQDMLLRVLETGEIQPVGAHRPRRVDVRVFAATDTDLEAAIAAGRFRLPLLHRLAAFELTIPPLRSRRDDVGRLLVHFLEKELDGLGLKHLLELPRDSKRMWGPASQVARLARHPWPGNVRELRNVIRRLAVLSRGSDRLHWKDALDQLLGPSAPPPTRRSTASTPTRKLRPADIDDDMLVNAMRANAWRLMPTARALGISRTSLYTLVERCSLLRTASDIGEDELRAAHAGCDGDLGEMSARLEVSADGIKRRLRELGIV